MITALDIITFERVGLETVDQLVRWQIEQFKDFERWLRDEDSWDWIMQRFSDRLAALEGELRRKQN